MGIGLAAIDSSFVQNPIQMAIGLFIIGMFAAIYHPVGLAMIARGGQQMGRDIAFNGVWGNMGVGCAALLTGFLIDLTRLAHRLLATRADFTIVWAGLSRQLLGQITLEECGDHFRE